jgi:hypothetical protein
MSEFQTNHFISLQQAIDLTTRYRNEKEGLLKSEYQNKGILPICESFEKSAIESLLAEADCVALRVYFGMDATKLIRLVIVGVNSNDEDILPDEQISSRSTLDDGGKIVEDGIRCPTICPPPSPLNGG